MEAGREARHVHLTPATSVSFGSQRPLTLASAIRVEHNGRVVSIDLERENDPEVLRQAAILLEAENRRLLARVMDLTRALIAAQGNDRVALQLEIESLQTQLEKRNRMLFGQSSERRPGEDGVEPKPRAPQKGHGPHEQKELRIVVEKHVLEDAERICFLRTNSRAMTSTSSLSSA